MDIQPTVAPVVINPEIEDDGKKLRPFLQSHLAEVVEKSKDQVLEQNSNFIGESVVDMLAKNKDITYF
jgi:hypothetical protein